MLLLLYVLKKDLVELCGILNTSLKTIRATPPVLNPSLESVAFSNAQMSQRGAIRKPLDVFSWVQVIRKVGQGDDARTMLSKWNNSYATKDFKLVGNKRMAILNMLDAPKAGSYAILDHIAWHGIDPKAVSEGAIAETRFPRLLLEVIPLAELGAYA